MVESLHVVLLDGGSAHTAKFRQLAPAAACIVDDATECDEVLDAVRARPYDAVVIDAAVDVEDVLGRLRSAALDSALVILRGDDPAGLPRLNGDSEAQRTVDVGGMNSQTLSLALQLAVERHRSSRFEHASGDQPLSVSRDPVSGLIAGQRLLDDIDRGIADAIRFSRPFSVAVAGIDRRADGNNPFAVPHVATVLERGLRGCDVLGRLDDGSFIMAMTATDLSAARGAIRRLQGEVARTPDPDGLSCTISVGLTKLRGLMTVDELIMGALDMADEAISRGPAGLCAHGVTSDN